MPIVSLQYKLHQTNNLSITVLQVETKDFSYQIQSKVESESKIHLKSQTILNIEIKLSYRPDIKLVFVSK